MFVEIFWVKTLILICCELIKVDKDMVPVYAKMKFCYGICIRWARDIALYRFSAFWLRSKCSICSYQLNIWYGPHWGPSILNWFLQLREVTGACSVLPAGSPGLAVLPGRAHPPLGENKHQHWIPCSSLPKHRSDTRAQTVFFMKMGIFGQKKPPVSKVWWKMPIRRNENVYLECVLPPKWNLAVACVSVN